MAKPIEFLLILGMERYSTQFFRQVEAEVQKEVPQFRLTLFEDRDTIERPAEVETAIARCDCLFMVIITLSAHAEWICPKVLKHDPPIIFGFESMPEIMQLTKVGTYNLRDSKGMPPSVQRVARLVVGGREEDILYGYLKLQKITRRVVNLLPLKRLDDFRNWTNVSTYWTHRNVSNYVNMFKLILREYCHQPKLNITPVVEIPTMGFAHPDAPQWFAKPEEYERWERKRKQKQAYVGTVALLSFRVHLLSGAQYHHEIVRTLEANQLRVLPIFVMGVEAHIVVREWLERMGVDVIINTMGFPLVGGPIGSSKPGLTTDISRELLSKLNVTYIAAQPMYLQTIEDWRSRGVGPVQSTVLYSLPEMDGAVAPVVLGGMQGNTITTVPDRLERLARLVQGFAKLRHKAHHEKKIAVVVYNYPPGMGNIATAALLDVPTSLVRLLQRLRKAGYRVGNFPEHPATLLRCIIGSNQCNKPSDLPAHHPPIPTPVGVSKTTYQRLVRPSDQKRITTRWGNFPGDIAPVGQDHVFIGGMQLENIYIGVQPPIGMPGDPMRLLFDRENTPHHQYITFYRWIVEEFGADAIIHMGMHGSAEWMPGLHLGVSDTCWPDILLGEVPNFYVYPMNNPAEANIAKRRGYSTIISHAIPPYGRAGLYKELAILKDMLDEYRTTAYASPELECGIIQKIDLLNLDVDLARHPDEPFDVFASRVYVYLRDLEQRLIVDSLHVLGEAHPPEQQLTLITEVLKIPHAGMASLADMIMENMTTAFSTYRELLAAVRQGNVEATALREQVDEACRAFVQSAVLENQPQPKNLSNTGGDKLIDYGRTLLAALRENKHEIDFLLKGLQGGYIPAVHGGDLLRDGLAVLPTGRNIHSLDPFRIPTDAAFERGKRIGESLLAKHIAQHGAYPETIAQVLWGIDTMKTKGEAIGTILGLIGARGVKDGLGKIERYELVPLQELGRPRIDVLITASGVFRDTFAGTIDMLDRLICDAAAANESDEDNFIRKHVQQLMSTGVSFEHATARIFTQAPGTYGTDVDNAVEGAAWEEREELESLFIRRNSFAYGGKKQGTAHPKVLTSLLGTVGHVAQEIDSVEYGLTDMPYYYSYSGALKAAAERQSGRHVDLSYVESFTAETKVQDLKQVLRMEYRTKMLNPKWYEGMMRHGANGVAEVCNRFTYMLGWSATTDAIDNWTYDQAAATFILDETMRQRLEAVNPEAVRNAVGRLLEANNRNMWQTDDETLERLRILHADLDDRLEGVT